MRRHSHRFPLLKLKPKMTFINWKALKKATWAAKAANKIKSMTTMLIKTTKKLLGKLNKNSNNTEAQGRMSMEEELNLQLSNELAMEEIPKSMLCHLDNNSTQGVEVDIAEEEDCLQPDIQQQDSGVCLGKSESHG